MKALILRTIYRYTTGDGSIYQGSETIISTITDAKTGKLIKGIDKSNLRKSKKQLKFRGYTEFEVETSRRTINNSRRQF